MPRRVTWVGHATVLIELAGARLLTDPVLRRRLLHIKRIVPDVDPAHHAALDAVLPSPLHYDHLDTPSLRLLDRDTVRLVVPAGASRLVAKEGFALVTELAVGDETQVGAVRIEAVPAIHDGRRMPFGAQVQTLGFVAEADGLRIYFAGDTDLFDGMAEIRDLDLALIPVWGWGPALGAGHLDPERAAEALALLRPRLAVPIHWGTLFPVGLRDRRRRLTDPPGEFERAAAKLAPGVEIRVLEPGQAIDI
jgi:L-ascorbate metabolism protein UlaG (beta-lactamase superfamily)